MGKVIIIIMLASIFLVGCITDNEQGNKIDDDSYCEQDSDCVSATQHHCYVDCDSLGEDCSDYSLCPVYHKDSKTEGCEKTVLCREPSRIICENNQCKSIE